MSVNRGVSNHKVTTLRELIACYNKRVKRLGGGYAKFDILTSALLQTGCQVFVWLCVCALCVCMFCRPCCLVWINTIRCDTIRYDVILFDIFLSRYDTNGNRQQYSAHCRSVCTISLCLSEVWYKFSRMLTRCDKLQPIVSHIYEKCFKIQQKFAFISQVTQSKCVLEQCM